MLKTAFVGMVLLAALFMMGCSGGSPAQSDELPSARPPSGGFHASDYFGWSAEERKAIAMSHDLFVAAYRNRNVVDLRYKVEVTPEEYVVSIDWTEFGDTGRRLEPVAGGGPFTVGVSKDFRKTHVYPHA